MRLLWEPLPAKERAFSLLASLTKGVRLTSRPTTNGDLKTLTFSGYTKAGNADNSI